MIKFILSNDEQYSYKYEITKPIKEILNDFCTKRGLLPDIYEAYDPVRMKVLDTSKSLHDYKLDSLHLKRVDSSMSSHDKLSDDDKKLWNSQNIRTYSQNSYSQTILNKENTEKKHKNGLMFKLKNRFTNKKHHIDRSYSESVVPQLESQIYALSTNNLHDEVFKKETLEPDITMIKKKKKRAAPPPPVPSKIENITLYPDTDTNSKPPRTFELEIPPPPSYSADIPDAVHYFPWQHHIECCTDNDDFGEDSVYSTISADPLPLTVSEHNIIETPIFRQTSDPTEDPGYVYATIQKSLVPIEKEDSDNSSIDTPRYYFKTANVIPEKRPKHRVGKNYVEPHVLKVTEIQLPHIDAQLQCTDISPGLQNINELPISARKIFFSPVNICAKSNQSSICSTSSDEPMHKNQALPITNLASISQNSLKEPVEDLKISVEDQSLKIQDLNIEQNLPESKRFLELSVNTDILTSTEKENIHKASHIPKFHLPLDHAPDQEPSLPKSEVIGICQKSHISDSSALADNRIVEQKSRSEESTKGDKETRNIEAPKIPPKPKNYIVEHLPRERTVKIERQGKSLFFKL